MISDWLVRVLVGKVVNSSVMWVMLLVVVNFLLIVFLSMIFLIMFFLLMFRVFVCLGICFLMSGVCMKLG